MDILQQAITEFKAQTAREYIALHASPCADMTVYQSKFGGVPYLPAGFPYPYSRLNPEQPLRLLAQINFAEMPPLADFPERGILQIYIDPADDRFFGCDRQIAHFEKRQVAPQSAYRVIWHESPDLSAPCSADIPDFDGEFPVSQPERITFEKKTGYMPYHSYGENPFEEAFVPVYNKYAEEPVGLIEDIENGEYLLEKTFDIRGTEHKLGGYRDDVWTPKWPDTEVLLLQIASDGVIEWGDDGIAHFTMTHEALRNRDFSRVDYHWECY